MVLVTEGFTEAGDGEGGVAQAVKARMPATTPETAGRKRFEFMVRPFGLMEASGAEQPAGGGRDRWKAD